MNKIHMDKRLNQLPTWLWTNSTTLPPVYKMVWEAVREDKVRSNGMQTELLVDTNKVFPLLLTSQLPTEVLGHIWNLANQKYAGQLTEQELYIVLALVAAAQTSYTFNSLDILHLLPFPPTPYLNIECLMNLQPVTQLNSASKFQNFNDNNDVSFISSESRYTSEVKGKTKLQHGIISSDVNLQMTNIVPGKVSSFDNKSHSSSTTMWDINNLFRDAKQAQRSHSDSKHSSAADPCDDFSEFQSAPIPSVSNIPNWDIKQGSAIGSRLANHNLGVKKPIEKSRKNNINAKSTHNSIQTRTSSTAINAMSHNKDQSTIDCLSELFPKCAIKNQSKTVILKDTVIRNNDPPKDYSDNITNHTNTISNTVHLINDKDVSNKLELTEKIAVSGTSDSAQQDLMNLQLIEDKYSALRALIEETTVPKLDPNASCTNHSVDEFGEFVSADQPATGTSTVNTLDTESFADIFTDFEFKSSSHNDGSVTDISLMPEISESFDNLKLDDTVERSLEMGKTLQKEDAISINSIEFMNSASGALTRSGSVPSLDLKSFLPSNAEEDHVQDTTHQTVYWEWKQYMESCVLLLQVAANIFTNITSELVLYEVLNSAQGYNFLCNLAEVAAVCRRVNFSYKEMDINIIGFDDLLMDIDRIWAEMEPFYTNIPIVTELPAWPLHQGDSTSCSLCLTVITSGRVVYNDNNYHVTCANLWLNCVNSHLPAMRHPSFYSHTNVCPGNNHI